MNVFQRTWHRVKKFVSARYEAAMTNYGERSWLFSNVQDARFDNDCATRLELVRKHRYWVKNSELVQRIRSLFIQFAVGPTGLNCVPNSTDETWNDIRAHRWALWCRRPELSSRHSMSELVILWAGALFDDGGCFVLKLQEAGRPFIQTVEAHRCQTPPQLKENEGKSIVDGVEIDGNMRPIAYWFVDSSKGASILGTADESLTYKRYPAEMVIHIFKPRRPGMIREIPEGVSAYNTLHDYQDLHLLEQKAARKIASYAVVIGNETGEADPAALRRARMGIGSVDSAGNTVTKERAIYYENRFGGDTVYKKKGETVENFKCDRPSIVTQQYWDLLISQICCGYNVPKLLVVPYSLQGTVTRADLDVCTSAFRFNFEVIASALREVYEWQTEWSVRYDREFLAELGRASISNATPPHYLAVVIRPPRPPNVDIGYNANATVAELKAGLITYQDLYAERQQDWRQQFRQAAEAEFFKKQLAKEFSRDGVVILPDEIAQKIEQAIVEPMEVDAKEAKTALTP